MNKKFKPLDQYEPELRASIKRIHELNKVTPHWCSHIMTDDEYYKSKFGDKMTKMDQTQL